MKRDYFRTNRAIASGDKSKAQRYWEFRSKLERLENVHVENLKGSRLHVKASPPKRKKPRIEDFLNAETQKLIAEDPDFTSCSSSGEDDVLEIDEDADWTCSPLSGEDDVLDLDTPVTNYAEAAVAALGRIPVSRTFRSLALDFFPALKEHSEYWRLFCYLLFGSRHDKDTSRLLVSAKILSALEGRDPNNSQAEKFLIRFNENVLGPAGGKIRWTDWYKPKGKCRQLTNRDFGLEFEELLRQEHLGKWDESGRVYLISGATYNRSNARKFRREQREAAGRLPTFCAHAEIIRSYMNTLKPNLFTTKVQENYKSALKATFNLPDGPAKDAQLRILAHIKSQPQPFYSPSEAGHTVRLSTSESMANLKRNVRRAITKGWDEADLRCSQFAICARLWNVPELLDFLSTGKSLWKRFFDYLHLAPEKHAIAKSVIKETIYSICFGMERHSIKWTTGCNLWAARLERGIAHELLKEPLIQALLNARDVALETIAAEGGAMTCYREWKPVTEKRQPRDIMAEIAQAWEMNLIYPAFELARQTREFTITLYQYDGFSVNFTRRPELWKQRIQELISENANRQGFMTWLEWSKKNLRLILVTVCTCSSLYRNVLRILIRRQQL